MDLNISNMPMSVVTDIVRAELTGFAEKYRQMGIPAFIVEGVLCEVLAEVRKDRAQEVAAGYQQMMAAMEEEGKDDHTKDKA